MKTKLFLALLTFALIFSCKSDDDGGGGFDGSLRSIEDFYSPEILDALEDLGFLINTGNTPPNLEGAYLFSPLKLLSSTVSGDTPGKTFANYMASFKNQNNSELTIDYNGNHIGASQVDEGNGAFISGSNNEFSMFLKTTTQISNSVPAESTIAISGKMTENGIEDAQMVLMMLDNKGNPDGVYIPDNTGRLLYDSNNFSEKQ
ncbi:hypothetical protein H7U19_01070 [Hyunsoonleella sp. SJ7]|uniref:Uncharacterized protein n=1 Tax=Hyunsoonleella aquatilis TaxID=2762758 RepID=A0A923HCM9_9FLAO|nr:hypothetical protein [Hyunsoonleella aquatilis]MBC3756975.1 hypothetical protein [Hyunsoonleella aquatilis]